MRRAMAFPKARFFFFIAMLASLSSLSTATKVSYDGRALKIDGERKIMFAGAIHYPRSTPEMWPDLMKKAKEGGLDAIETYVFWNGHEPRRREYNFEGNFDLIRFIKEVHNAGLYAVLRIGPYVCAEWNYGGLPVWLHQIDGIELRTNNQKFKEEMEIFTNLIVDMVKKEKLLAPQGGPIILLQIENEYGNIQGPYGDAGKEYIKWCAKLAESQNADVPWLMCQQNDAPQPMINTCNGFYCDNWTPNNPKSPKMWTENWTGWFKAWDKPDPHRLAEDLAYAVARFFQSNGTFQNYYMYHGGTNFGRSTGGPYITTSYDYDAPLDEYGNIRQPKWGHLKELHAAIKKMEKALTHGDVENTNITNEIFVTKFHGNGITPGCFITNTNATTDATVNHDGKDYFVPAWSISVLPDCKEEVYNTAKVTTQTSVLVKKPNLAEKEPEKLQWSWRPERLGIDRASGHKYTKNGLVEQLLVTGDDSDYLWYTTSINNGVKGKMTLSVNTTGHVLHAFVNGRLVGSQYAPNGAFQFVFERPVEIKDGKNSIALLSATVGLKNYGAHYDLMPAGIVGGPVKLIGDNVTTDLSKVQWSYKVGLDGMDRQLYNERANLDLVWHSGVLPTKRPFTWYKTTFQTPLGSHPVVVDLLGMGKGEAWVNGESIGRFWPNYTASLDGCKKCDYRGEFKSDSCQTGCGEPSQRWYHVPRAWLRAGEPNTLTLFEEAGGNPGFVNFQTVALETVCGSVYEGRTLELSCEGSGRTITKIQFASFGDAQGECGAFEKGSCEAPGSFSRVSEECLGKPSCSIAATEALLGETSACGKAMKKLTVQAVCGGVSS